MSARYRMEWRFRIAHQIDHLHGLLYTTRMRPGVEPIPVEEYHGTGRAWSY